jgi:sarcosine oxidase subunit alpha
MPLYSGCTVIGTAGRRALRGVSIRPLAGGGGSTAIDCDLLAVSGGWNPALHLFAQAQGRLRFDENLAAFVPDGEAVGVECVGAARGSFGLARCLAEGAAAGARAAGGGRRSPERPAVAAAAVA